MMRVSEQQARLLFGSKKPTAPRAPRARRRKEELPENVVAQTILDFLRVRGWHCERQTVGTFVAYYNYANKVPGAPVVRVGVKGQADWLAVRPVHKQPGMTESFDLEVKAPGKSPRTEQLEWMRKRQVLGFLADWFDCFDSGRRPFLPWYRARFGEK